MRNSKYISLLIAAIGIVFSASVSRAQVTATATVTLTVVSAPGVNFAPSAKWNTLSSPVADNGSHAMPEMTFRSPGNVLVRLNSVGTAPEKFNLEQGQVKTFTANELKGVSSVEIDYLGS